jgi:hypothetical protein
MRQTIPYSQLLFLLVAGCATPTEPQSCEENPLVDCEPVGIELPDGAAMILDEVGRVSLAQDGVVLFLVDRGMYQTAYQVFPELPYIYHEDGLRIRFNGILSPIPPGVRMQGAPLRWTSIQRD